MKVLPFTLQTAGPLRGSDGYLTYIFSGRVSTRRRKNISEFQNPRFQNEAKYTTFLAKISFICMRMKNHFRIKG